VATDRGRPALAALTSLAAIVSIVVALPLGAQVPVRTSRWQPELRADAFTGDPWAAHAGAGINVRLGWYARLALAGGVGASSREDAAGERTSTTSGRVELMGRFVADPFRERSRGPYAAAGLVQRLERGARPRTRLTALLGVEGRPRGGWVPSLEAGFGGGVRVGVVLRRTLADGR
jgi:hypothetical protein